MHSLYARFVLWLIRPALERWAAMLPSSIARMSAVPLRVDAGLGIKSSADPSADRDST